MSASAGTVRQSSVGSTGVTNIAQSGTYTAGSSYLAIALGPSGTTWTVASTNSGSFGAPKAGITTIGGGEVGVWTLDGITGGADSITATPNGGSSTAFIGLAVVEILGTGGYDGVGTTPVNLQTSGTTRTGTNAAPSTTSGLVIGFLYNDTQNNSGSVDTGNSYSALTGSGLTAGQFMDFSSGNTFCCLEGKNYAINTPLPATFITVVTGSTTGGVTIIFKDAGGPVADGSYSFGDDVYM